MPTKSARRARRGAAARLAAADVDVADAPSDALHHEKTSLQEHEETSSEKADGSVANLVFRRIKEDKTSATSSSESTLGKSNKVTKDAAAKMKSIIRRFDPTTANNNNETSRQGGVTEKRGDNGDKTRSTESNGVVRFSIENEDQKPAATTRTDKTDKPVAEHPQERSAILLRTEVLSQPRPSPPFSGLANVVAGPYAGMSGYLSSTGTRGYSLLSTSDGNFATVSDKHVVDASAGRKPPPKKKTKRQRDQNARGDEGISTRDLFIGCLKTFVQDEEIESQKVETGQLRDAASSGEYNEEMQELQQELIQMQQFKLDQMYAENPLIKIATEAFDAPPPTKTTGKSKRKPPPAARSGVPQPKT